jgi:uncharacterized protein (TIRG00374 family)
MRFKIVTSKAMSSSKERLTKSNFFRDHSSYFVPLIGFFVASILVYFAGPQRIYATVLKADYKLLILAALVANLPLIIYGLVWKKVLSFIEVDLDLKTNYQVLLSNTFVNNLTPFGNIGGEVAATYYLSKLTDKSTGEIFSAVFLASLINFTPIISISLIGLLFLGYWEVSLITTFFVLVALIYMENIIAKLPYFGLNSKIEKFISDFKSSKSLFAGKKKVLVSLLAVTHFSIVFNILSVLLLVQAYGSEILLFDLMIILPLARAANYAPTPGGSGSYEVALTGLLVILGGIGFSTAVSVALAYRIVTYYLGLLFGYIAFTSLHITQKSHIK